MDPGRSCYSTALCLLILSSASHLCSGSASYSLWGQKVHLQATNCMWRLIQEVPSLEELSVCQLLYPTMKVPRWTGFVYKPRGQKHIELGLTGRDVFMEVWLMDRMFHVKQDLPLNQWTSLCVTWSSLHHRLSLYINGSRLLEATLNTTLGRPLAPNGTLTLGVSHIVNVGGHPTVETGKNFMGDISLFRMWSRERSAEELLDQTCTDGDVISWDTRDWNYTCLLIPDKILTCKWSLYKILMTGTISPKNTPPLKLLLRKWLETVFPHYISVKEILVSPVRPASHGSNETVLGSQKAQDMENSSKSTSNSFFSEIYVTVLPEMDVSVVQTDISDLLRPAFSTGPFNLTADPSRLTVKPFARVNLPPVSTTPDTFLTVPSSAMAEFSTTREPLHPNYTLAVDYKDTFFRVQLTLNMSGEIQEPINTINKWLQNKLRPHQMETLHLKIQDDPVRHSDDENTHGLEMIPRLSEKAFKCAFHIQAFGTRNITETTALIYKLLTAKHTDMDITIQAQVTEITHIEPGVCHEDTTKGIYGEYVWPSGEPEQVITIGCHKNPSDKGSRKCELDHESETAIWQDPDFRNCNPVFTFNELGDIIITPNNTGDVVTMIEQLVDRELGSDGSLTEEEVNTVVNKLAEALEVATVTSDLGSQIIGIIGDLLGSDTVLSTVGNSILNLTESVGDQMLFPGESVSVAVPSLGLSMVNLDPDHFQGLTFGVSSFSTGLVPEIFVNQSFVSDPLEGAVASISLPSALQTILQSNGKTRRVQFQFHGLQELFKDNESNLTLNSYVVSASVSNRLIRNLSESVVVILKHLRPKESGDNVHCVFWDFQKNSGQGGWSRQGCVTDSSSPYLTSCHCNHLTHFGVLLDVSRTPISEVDRQILSVLSYLGCGVSSIFLGISLLTYTAFGKLRKDYPSKILLNLSGALLGLNMLFLLNSWLSSFNNYGLCITTAATMHYFLLASFTWMGLEAVHMYFALVKVFNVYIPSYILKFCAIGWGLPLVIVSLVLAIDMDAYGSELPRKSTDNQQNSESFCWLQSNVAFYITVLAFVLLVMLINLSVFTVVLIQIRHMRTNKPAGNQSSVLQDLRAAASLTVLLGLTWPLAFFALGPAKVPLLYFFSILNSLQGFFIFVFHCLMKENVRKQWRIHLCCGRFRLNDYSDWSRSVTLGDRCKQNQLVNTPSLRSVDTSSRKISDSSTGSAPVDF